jgi:molybdate transport system substrate-binding protein
MRGRGPALVAVLLASIAGAQAPPPGLPAVFAEKVANAKPGDVRVLATAAILHPLEAVRAEAAKAIGHPIVIEYGSARGNLKTDILNGEAFDVAILLPDVDAELVKANRIKSKTYSIAEVPAAIGIRGDATVDVSTPEALKTTLLKAKSVMYAPTGAAHDTVVKLLSGLAIADSIKDSSKAGPASRVALVAGEYEVDLYPLSEITGMKGVKNLGPVISQFQVPSVIEASISKQTTNEQAAKALIRFLQGSALEEPLKNNGMTPKH